MEGALEFLGLARRAGATVHGTAATRDAIRSGRARLVVMAEDASKTQKEKVERLLRHRSVPSRVLGSRNELGRALGTGPLSAVAVTDPSIAKALEERLGGWDVSGTAESSGGSGT